MLNTHQRAARCESRQICIQITDRQLRQTDAYGFHGYPIAAPRFQSPSRALDRQAIGATADRFNVATPRGLAARGASHNHRARESDAGVSAGATGNSIDRGGR